MNVRDALLLVRRMASLRLIDVCLAFGVLIAGAALVLPDLARLPQLRFSDAHAQLTPLMGVLIGVPYAGVLRSPAWWLEGSSPRIGLWLRLLLPILGLASAGISSVVLVLLAGPGGYADVATVRNALASAATAIVLGRLCGLEAGLLCHVMLVGIVLFAGFDAAGQVASWALYLFPGDSTFAVLVTLVLCFGAVLVGLGLGSAAGAADLV